MKKLRQGRRLILMQEGAPSLTGEVFAAVQGRARLHGMDSVSGLHVLGSDTCALAFRVANGICCVSAGTCFQLRVQTNGASPCAEVSAFHSNTFICFCNGEVNPNALCFLTSSCRQDEVRKTASPAALRVLGRTPSSLTHA